MESFRGSVLASFARLTSSVPGLVVWDTFPIVCPPGDRCSAFAGDKPLSFDAEHLSRYGNRLLLPSFLGFFSGADMR